MANDEKVNVAIVSEGLQSHINPTLRFAKRLLSKGVNSVTIITTEVARDRMLKNNTPNPHSQIQFEFFSDGLSIDFDRNKDMKTFVDSLHSVGTKNLSTLITNLTKVQQNKYSCMIVDPLVYPAIDIAFDHGIPCALFWLQPCVLFSLCYRYFNNINSFPNLDDPNEKVILPGLPALDVSDVPSYMLPSAPSHLKQILVNMCKVLDKVKWVFAISFFELEEETVKSMDSLAPMYPIGPLVSEFMLGEEKEKINSQGNSILEWLDTRESSSVIYISFGTVILLSQEQVDNIALALKKSEKSFLWVVKGYENVLPQGFVEETKGRGLVVTWCEQEKVLLHPSVGCFVTHCGWNSMLETVVAGVPVIAYPKWLDQPASAKVIVKKFGNGVVVNYGEDRVASAEEMERCIKEVMEAPSAGEIKQRAIELKVAAKKALEENGSSGKNISQFVNELKNVP
ncbi:hypothetical protein RJT34_05710 [Clitoria ternatea]|uniref:Glycosyltransferase n=1 Tax=Clitoria ternatea TaxID=43366 RepID=A0AAN9K2Z1_CLITE